MVSAPFRPAAGMSAEIPTIRRFVSESASSNTFMLRDGVRALEQALCERTGWPYAIACASQAGALMLAGRAAGVRRGDRVAVPALCSPAAVTGLARLGAQPVPVPVVSPVAASDPASVGQAARRGVKVFVVAHPFAVPTDLSAVADALHGYDAVIIEDASDVQGLVLTDGLAGRENGVAVVDLSPGRPLASVGEAAAVLTRDPEIDRRCRRLRNHGQDGVHRFMHHEVGYNSRMDEIVARFAFHALDGLSAEVRRATMVARYHTALAELSGLTAPALSDLSIPDAYVVLTDDRDELRTHLSHNGIDARTRDLTALPGVTSAAELARRHLSLPLHTGLSDGQVAYVAEQVASHYA